MINTFMNILLGLMIRDFLKCKLHLFNSPIYMESFILR